MLPQLNYFLNFLILFPTERLLDFCQKINSNTRLVCSTVIKLIYKNSSSVFYKIRLLYKRKYFYQDVYSRQHLNLVLNYTLKCNHLHNKGFVLYLYANNEYEDHNLYVNSVNNDNTLSEYFRERSFLLFLHNVQD